MSFRRYVLRWLCLSLCYLAFAGALSKAEVVAAVLTGAFAAILSLGLRIKGERRLSLRGRWPAVLAATGVQLVRDAGRVGATLLRALFRSRGYRGQVVLDRDAAATPVGSGIGRRAATALLASVTPDGVALEHGDEHIAVHRLSRVRGPTHRRRDSR